MGTHELFGQVKLADVAGLQAALDALAPKTRPLPTWVPVTAYGAKGDGTTDDTAAIQAAIADAPAGSTVYFPGGTYRVSATIRLRSPLAYIGPGGRAQLATIKAVAGFTGPAVVAAQGWWDSASTCDMPIRMEGLQIDASGVSGVHGLVVFNFWSRFVDLQIRNVAGASARGIYCTDRGRNGSTVTTNSHSENTFEGCRFYDHTAGASAFWAESINGYSNQDGHLRNAFYSGIGGYGIRITRAAGWSVVDNHLYGIGYDGISLDNVYATRVLDNYVEDFGGQNSANPGAPTFGYYNGITLATVLNDRASVLSGNTVSTSQPSSPAGQRWTCFYARAGSGQLRAHLVATGNTAVFASGSAPATPKSYGWYLGEGGDSGRLLTVEWAANQIQDVAWWAGKRVVPGGATVVLTEPVLASDVRLVADAPAGQASVRTLGTGAQQAAAGNHTHTPASIGAVPTTRTVGAGAGLSGGGDLSADRSLAVAYGSAANTAVQGNDARVTADQAAGTASIRTLGTGAQQAAAGNHTHTPGSIGAAAATHTHDAGDIASGTLALARIPTAADGESSASKVLLSNDGRLTNSRVPSAHATSHAPGGSDDLSGSYLALSGNQTAAGTKTFSGTAIFNAPPQVAEGTLAYHPVRRDDARLAPDAAAAQASVRTIGTGALQAAAGNHTHTPASIGAADAAHTHTPASIGALGRLTPTGTKTAAYTAVPGELVMVDASAGPLTVTLPAASGGGWVGVKKIDSSANIVTVAAAGTDTIGSAGAASIPIRLMDQTGVYQPNGSNWVIERSHLSLAALDARFAPTARQIAAGAGLTGGGDLTADRSLAVVYGTAANTAAQGNDSRIVGAVQTGDARVTADQAAGTASIRTLGTGSQQAAAGNHTHTPASIGAVATSRTLTAGAGLSGGGDLSADRSFAVAYGSAANTAVQGNDTRVTADQAAGTASIRTLGTGSTQAAAGNHGHTPSSIGAADAVHTHTGQQIMVASRTVAYADLPTIAPLTGVAVDVAYSVLTGSPTIAPAAGTDGQIIRLRMLASGAQRTPAVSTAVRLGTGIANRSMDIPSGQVGVFGLEYIGALSLWVLFSEYVVSAS